MIHVERGPAPAGLTSSRAGRLRQELAAFFKTPAAKRTRERFKFAAVTQLPGVVDALRRDFGDRCGYCESWIGEENPGQMDSFRPKQRAMGLDGKIAEEHYWWLAYEWANMVAACLACNRAKATRFPIRAGRRGHPEATAEQLRRERPLLLDPCFDVPEKHLLFDRDGRVASATDEGRTTIEVLGLNRADLVARRRRAYQALEPEWRRLQFLLEDTASSLKTDRLKSLRKEVEAQLGRRDREFHALRRQFLQQWSREVIVRRSDLTEILNPFLSLVTALPAAATPVRQRGVESLEKALAATFRDYSSHVRGMESFSVEDDSSKANYYSRSRFVERIKIRNFKVIRELDLTIPPAQDRGACLLFLGENGVGKSSILQAVALALMGRSHQQRLAGLDASAFLTAGETAGSVEVYLTGDPDPVELRFHRGATAFELRPEDPKVLLLGYGATRLLPRFPGPAAPASGAGAARADNLFSPFVPLNDASSWLCGLPATDFERMKHGLRSLLLLPDDAGIWTEPGSPPMVKISSYGDRVSLEQLSDGFQSVVALAADVMSVMRLRWPEMDLAEGIVLIDEIDAHLHPRWKMQVVERLRQVFPRLQFLMTSHDPLCLRGLKAGEVTVLQRRQDGRVGALTDLPSPEGLRIDQILTSEFFGLNSTRSPEDDKLFEEYYGLLARRRLAAPEKARLAALREQLAARDLMGSNRRERVMLEAADRFVAESRQQPDADQREALAEATRKQIVDLWNDVRPRGNPR